MLTLQNWLSFYEKNYEFVGLVSGSLMAPESLRTRQRMKVCDRVPGDVKTTRKPSWQPHGQASRENGKMSSVVFWVQHWFGDPAHGDHLSHDTAATGKVIGRFYGEDGLPTPELTLVEAMISKGLEANKQALQEKHQFPPCNSEWSSARGSRFWCSPNSGGVSRDWTGVPRKLYKPGAKEPHCVCVRTTGPPSDQVPDNPAHRNRGDLDHPNLEEYTGCPPLSMACSFPL
ncbi:neuferricin isoform 3-T4 [Glossophaga mutica]